MASEQASRPWQRHRGNRDSSTWSIWLVGVVIAMILALGVTLWVLGKQNYVPIDSSTLCPTNQRPSQVVVVLLDVSDEFTEAQRLFVRSALQDLLGEVARLGLVDVYTIDGASKSVVRPVLEMCNPGDGSELNRLYANPAMAKKQWETFSERINSEIDKIIAGPGSSISPIMEAVQATALRTFGQYTNVPKRLYIVSDMMQHVPGKLSQLTSAPTFDAFRSTPYFGEVRASLADVRVSLLYLVRPRAPQQWPAHRVFWEAYFQAQGASLQSITPVYGGQ